MAETTAFFQALHEAFNQPQAPKTSFFLKMDHAQNFVHVETEIDDAIGVGFASFTSYRGTLDGYDAKPTYRLDVNISERDGMLYLRATNGLLRVEEDEVAPAVATVRNWRDLGIELMHSTDVTFFQIGALFRQIIDQEKFTLSSKFRLYEREAVAA